MNLIDNPTLPDPFGPLIASRADPDIDPLCRALLDAELLILEASEAASGRRHLTITHGCPTDATSAERLLGLNANLRTLATRCEWARIRGETGYVTVTIAGDDAEDRLFDFLTVAAATNPGGWAISQSAVPALS